MSKQPDLKLTVSDDDYELIRVAKPLSAAAAAFVPAKDAKDSKQMVKAPLGARLSQAMGLKLGLKPLRIVLPVSFNLTNTAASLCAGVLAVDVTSSTEWSALQGLYDEYRFVGAKMCWFAMADGNFAVPASYSDLMWVVAYDPADSVALTGVRNGCEMAQHQLVAPVGITNNGTAVTIAGFTPTTARPLTFRFQPKMKSLSINASGAVTAAPGSWKALPTAGSNGAPDGWMKFYNYNGLTNGQAIAGGVLFYEVELRSRK